MRDRVIMSKLIALVGFVVMSLFGCDYSNQQALRSYDEMLEGVRHTIDDLARYQPRLQDKGSSSLCKSYVKQEVLTRCRMVVKELHAIKPESPRLMALHSELLDIWTGYVDCFEAFVDDLENHNLRPKKLELQKALERQEVQLRWWNGEFQAYQDQFE